MITEDFKIGVIKSNVDINEILILNPKGYADRIMFDVPAIYIDFNIPDLLKKKAHLKEMRVDVKEFTVIKSKDGDYNINSLKVVKIGKVEQSEKIEVAGIPNIRIDNLTLKIGKIIYKDYSQRPSPVVWEFPVNIEERIENVEDLQSVVRIIVVEAIRKSALKQLIDINLERLVKPIRKTLENVKQVSGKVSDAAKKSAAKTAETIKKTGSVIAETFQAPPKELKTLNEKQEK
ncbi:MAG: hypothetical protein ISS46_00455 [Candidatus Omnitrophica bacterium]|nr:hypothetical protein [Candidatus Omnitrophota bacterium]